ncbi:MAG: energy transducer TonB [Balneolaceae bacterium]
MQTQNSNVFKENPLKKYYPINIEIGIIISLIITIALFKIDFYPEAGEIEYIAKDEIIQIEEIEQTRQEQAPPPPPRPPVPVEVPNDEILIEELIDLDTELHFSEKLTLPPAPPTQAGSENEKNDEDEIFVSVEQMPEMIGGLASLYNKLRYPEAALKNKIEGKVTLQFVINEKGEVTNPVVLRGIGYGCDEEALRVIQQVKFTPGLQRGRPVKVRASIQVIFTLLHK